MRSLQQRSNSLEQSLLHQQRKRHQRPSERNPSNIRVYPCYGFDRAKSMRVPARVNNQTINAEEASDQPRLPAAGSTKPPISASNTLAFVTRKARRRMRVTLCSQLILRNSAAR